MIQRIDSEKLNRKSSANMTQHFNDTKFTGIDGNFPIKNYEAKNVCP